MPLPISWPAWSVPANVGEVFAVKGNAWLAFEGSGPPGVGADVVMLHAGVADRRSWQPLVDLIADKHRCIRFDARGYGETTYEPEAFSTAADALSVMDKAEIEEAVVVGNSVGGGAAIDLALANPERVSGLALIGPAVGGAPEQPAEDETTRALEQQLHSAQQSGDVDALNAVEARIWLDGPLAPEGRVQGPVRDLFLDMNGRALRADDPGETGLGEDSWSRLGEIGVPVQVLVGELDVPEFQQLAAELAERIPDAELVRLPGVAHLPQLEGDPMCLHSIAAFVSRIPPEIS